MSVCMKGCLQLKWHSWGGTVSLVTVCCLRVLYCKCERSGANSDQCPVGIVHYLDTSENSICGEINKACIF